MEALSEFDAELAATVRGALHVRSRDYRAQLDVEKCPPEMSRRSFVRWKVKQLLVTDVEWQFAAFSQVQLTPPVHKSALQPFCMHAHAKDLTSHFPRAHPALACHIWLASVRRYLLLAQQVWQQACGWR